MTLKDVFLMLFLVLLVATVAFGAGLYGYKVGLNKGLSRAPLEYQNCVTNGAKGWYVENDEFNCVF